MKIQAILALTICTLLAACKSVETPFNRKPPVVAAAGFDFSQNSCVSQAYEPPSALDKFRTKSMAPDHIDVRHINGTFPSRPATELRRERRMKKSGGGLEIEVEPFIKEKKEEFHGDPPSSRTAEALAQN